MNSFLLTLVQFIAVILVAPFVTGLVRMCKARFQGRHGASPFLPYITYATLLKKQMVISKSTSWVFRLVPFVVLATTLFLVCVLPLLVFGGAFVSLGHFMIVAGVLALGAAFLVMGGLESASAFGGMGASREMTLASLVEPAMIATFATFSIVTGAFTVDAMFANAHILTSPALIPAIAALIMVALAENARYPVDNPATHLELTMVHEAMVLEYSGPYLAMLEYASAVKLTIFSLLVANILFPMTLAVDATLVAILITIAYMIVKVIVVSFLLALLESLIAKMRFYRMQEYMTIAFFFALAGLVFALIHITL
ncbi:MAG: NADH-quinone oxidoreductase subunit H [Candidatus Uhrbacteria bacterium]|nr:NADH-quinone oxidoreductase subunit H [Candidatus Uhrbacteria bacterium]